MAFALLPKQLAKRTWLIFHPGNPRGLPVMSTALPAGRLLKSVSLAAVETVHPALPEYVPAGHMPVH